MLRTIDLNADVGEERGDDRALLALVSSANIATGAHAGGGDILVNAIAQAIEAGCAVGAHPSYPDREGFGRRRPPRDISSRALAKIITEQVLLVARECAGAGSALHHVKPHGTLYNDAADDAVVAACLLDAIEAASRQLGDRVIPVVGLAGSRMGELATQRGVPFIAEAFADRAYDDKGRLVSRSNPGAVLQGVDEIRQRVVDIALHGLVRTIDGGEVAVRADTICLHGDAPDAVAHARAARAALVDAGVQISSVDSAP